LQIYSLQVDFLPDFEIVVRFYLELVEYFENRADDSDYLEFEITENVVQLPGEENNLPIPLFADRPRAVVVDKPGIVDESQL